MIRLQQGEREDSEEKAIVYPDLLHAATRASLGPRAETGVEGEIWRYSEGKWHVGKGCIIVYLWGLCPCLDDLLQVEFGIVDVGYH